MQKLGSSSQLTYTAPMLAVLLAACSSAQTDVDRTNEQRATLALFDQFETVVYAREEVVRSSGSYKGLPEQSVNLLRIPFGMLLAGLTVSDALSSTLLDSAEAVLVGAKDFQPPAGLGAVQSRFCYVVVLRDGNTIDLNALARSTRMSAAGPSVWTWQIKGEEGHPQPYTFFATQVGRAYVLIANEPTDLPTIATRLSLAEETRSRLNGIREWSRVSAYDIWGYRRYQLQGDRRSTAAGTSDVAPDAEAITFFVDVSQKAVIAWLFAASAATADKLNATTAHMQHIQFKAARPGVWEAIIPLDDPDTSYEPGLVVLELFGFSIYV